MSLFLCRLSLLKNMGIDLSPEEVRAATLEVMGSPLGELYDILYNQVA